MEYRQVQETDLVVQSSDMGLINIASLSSTGALDLSPRFQRRDRWDRGRQSQLIESFLLNIPVPPVYLAEEARGVYAVIDGKQRLTAISQYLGDEFPLKGLTLRPELEGRYYSELDSSDSRPLGMRPLRTVIILRQTPDWVKHEVFLRLNLGGKPLNNQEVRNVAFAGPFNDKIIELAENEFLRRQLKITSSASSAYSLMADVEYVVRFFAVAEQWDSFGGSLRGALDEFMIRHSKAEPSEIETFARRFKRAVRACEALWGNLAFRRFDGSQWRDQMMGAVYDAQMVAVDAMTDAELKRLASKPEAARERMEKLFANPDFDAAVRTSTNTPSRVRMRVESLSDLLKSMA